MARLYHEALGREIPVADEVLTDESLMAPYADQGWLPAPEPEVVPGLVPEPVRYEPAKPAAKTTKKTAK